jgi:hypothetical protein
MGAHQPPPVDQEGRRSANAQPTGLRDVIVDRARELPAVETARECPGVDPEVGRVADEPRPLERRLLGVEAVVVRPVTAGGAGAAGGLVGGAREIVSGEREVLVDEADRARKLLQQLVQRPLDPPAVGSLVVRELDDRHRRVDRPLDHRRLDRELDLRVRARRRERGKRECEQRDAETSAQAARPSSGRDVMM